MIDYHGTRKKKTSGKKNWIAGAIKKPGQLHKDLGVPADQPIPDSKLQSALTGSKGSKVRQRAQFAENAKGFKH